ncbi:MAG TPA: rhomboid family intramembrane serine protease [Gammaproteobacteria bacterium]
MSWRDLERLPRAAGDEWQARRGGGRIIVGKREVDAAVAKWHPLDPLLIARPGGGRFLPVLEIPELRDPARRGLLRKQLWAIAVLAVLACVFAMSAYFGAGAQPLRAAGMALAVAAFAAADYHLVLKRLEALRERALFVLWITEKARVHVLGWSAVMIAAGALQLYGERKAGHEALVLEYGTVFERIREGEIWRLVVGPFLHSGLDHWFMNFVMLVLGGAIAGPLLGAAVVGVFLAGSTAGALTVLALSEPLGFDAYLGVSAGIFALYGWCAGAAAREPHAFPMRFAVTAFAFAVLNVLIAWLGNPNSSNVGHCAGLLCGLVWGAALPPRPRTS